MNGARAPRKALTTPAVPIAWVAIPADVAVFTASDLQQWQRECIPERPLPAPEADPPSA